MKSLYGTRDAGANWHEAYSSFIKEIGLLQGVTNPCHFFTKSRELKGIVHGDDFLFSGCKADLDWLRGKFEKKFECRVNTIGRRPS